MKIIHREILPSNTKSVHASTIEIWNDHPVFSWFGGSREGAPDVNIHLYNLNDKKETIIIGQREAMPRWNPILVNINEELILFEKAGVFCDRWQTFIHNVTDWDENTTPKEIEAKKLVLPAGLNGPVKSRPVIKLGTMYCGSSVETPYDWTSYIEEFQVGDSSVNFDKRSKPLNVPRKVLYSNPFNGETRRSLGVIQPTLWFDGDKLCAFFRSSGGLNSVYFSERVQNGGEEWWTQPVPTNLPNPNSAVDVATYNGRLFMIWNPSKTDRFPLVVSEIKRTGDAEFKTLDNIVVQDNLTRENFINKGCNSPELSYPYMIENNGKLHITYTYGRSKINYCIVQIK